MADTTRQAYQGPYNSSNWLTEMASIAARVEETRDEKAHLKCLKNAGTIRRKPVPRAPRPGDHVGYLPVPLRYTRWPFKLWPTVISESETKREFQHNSSFTYEPLQPCDYPWHKAPSEAKRKKVKTSGGGDYYRWEGEMICPKCHHGGDGSGDASGIPKGKILIPASLGNPKCTLSDLEDGMRRAQKASDRVGASDSEDGERLTLNDRLDSESKRLTVLPDYAPNTERPYVKPEHREMVTILKLQRQGMSQLSIALKMRLSTRTIQRRLAEAERLLREGVTYS